MVRPPYLAVGLQPGVQHSNLFIDDLLGQNSVELLDNKIRTLTALRRDKRTATE